MSLLTNWELLMLKIERRPTAVTGYQLQYLLLWMLYHNLEDILGTAVNKLDRFNSSRVLFNVKMTGTDDNDKKYPSILMLFKTNKNEYVLNFHIYTSYNTSRAYEVTLGKGANLINRRVRNELGVILNRFLDKELIERYSRALDYDVEVELNTYRDRHNKPNLIERLKGGINPVLEQGYCKWKFNNLRGTLFRKVDLWSKPTFFVVSKVILEDTEHHL